MFVAVVYESLFGNTRDVAEVIAAGIREADPAAEAVCGPAAQAQPRMARADMLIAGAPTHFLGLPSRRSRVMQLRHSEASGTWYITGPVPRLPGNIAARPGMPGRAASSLSAPAGMREWLAELPQAAPGACAAAFDTRLDKLMSGSAAREIGHSLRNLGYQLVAAPEGFSVADFEGPLAAGERDRARQWGIQAYRAALQQRTDPAPI